MKCGEWPRDASEVGLRKYRLRDPVKECRGGRNKAAICWRHGISEQIVLSVEGEVPRLRGQRGAPAFLEHENTRLKRLAADLTLDNQALKEFSSEKADARGASVCGAGDADAIQAERTAGVWAAGLADPRVAIRRGARTCRALRERLRPGGPSADGLAIAGSMSLLRREGYRGSRAHLLAVSLGEARRVPPSAAGAALPAGRRSRGPPDQRALVARLRARHLRGRPTRAAPDGGGRLHPSLPGDRGRHFYRGGHRVVQVLQRLVETRGTPAVLIMDNGPKFLSRALDAWAYAHGIRLHFIDPGKPNQNAFIESFNGRLRDECLNEHWYLGGVPRAPDRGLARGLQMPFDPPQLPGERVTHGVRAVHA